MKEIIYIISERAIPSVLLESDDFQNLDEIQKQNFASRLRYIEEIYIKCQKWLQSREGFESTLDLVDELEQDIFINLSGDDKESISPWLIHSSWTFNTSPDSMRSYLPECLIGSVGVEIGFDCDEEIFLKWIENHANCLSALLDKFYGSNDLDCAIGCLIGIDITLSVLLSGTSKQRFNASLE